MQKTARKKVLFIGVTRFDLRTPPSHLEKKFSSLSQEVDIFVIARGRPFSSLLFGAHFYLVRARLFFVPTALAIGASLCMRGKVTTIVCQGPLTEGVVGALLKVVFRKELIVEVHGDWVEGPFLNKKRVFAPFLRKGIPIVAGFSFARADKIRAVAGYFLKELREKYPRKKYFVFPTYSDLSLFFEEKDIHFKKYICTVAVLSPIKNIETLIAAFKKVSEKFPEYTLIVAGDGPSLENLKLKVKNEKLEDGVVFTGRLTSREVKNVMKDCSLFILPSLSEGLPRVLLEAMALGKPVIASRVGGIPEIVQEGVNGLLADPKNEDALAEKIEYLLQNPQRARKMGEAGQFFTEKHFSNEKYIKNYLDMIYS